MKTKTTQHKLRDNALELLNEKTVYYYKCDIPCSITFKFDDYSFYVKENDKSYDTLNKALHQYYREYFKQNELDLKIAINVWSSMRDEDGRTVDEMLEEYKNELAFRDNELYDAIEELRKKSEKNISNVTNYNSAPDTRQVGQSFADYQRQERENMRYCRSMNIC